MIKNRALLIRLSRILVVTMGVKTTRTVFDDSAVLLHVVNTLRTKKVDNQPAGPLSQKVQQAIAKDFEGQLEVCEVRESRTNVYIPHARVWESSGRSITGSIILKGVDETTLVFSLDPQSGVLTVRELGANDQDLRVNRVF